MYNRVVTGTEDARQSFGAAWDEERAGQLLAGLNEVIRAGEEARELRAELVRSFAHSGWTQERIARLTGMSQPAVSKQLAKSGARDARSPGGLSSLDQRDTPWLEGRLWGLAEEIARTTDGGARCARFVVALARGRKRLTAHTVDELRRLVEEDLRRYEAELPPGLRTAYDAIARALDLPEHRTASTPTTPTASARRALARQVQRERLR